MEEGKLQAKIEAARNMLLTNLGTVEQIAAVQNLLKLCNSLPRSWQKTITNLFRNFSFKSQEFFAFVSSFMVS
ncbi:MAG: hypothetical protein IKK38_13530 [Spirochaetaceae bacterium]|nr:hypothetical protein [Spirochaetaceae bacterium]